MNKFTTKILSYATYELLYNYKIVVNKADLIKKINDICNKKIIHKKFTLENFSPIMLSEKNSSYNNDEKKSQNTQSKKFTTLYSEEDEYTCKYIDEKFIYEKRLHYSTPQFFFSCSLKNAFLHIDNHQLSSIFRSLVYSNNYNKINVYDKNDYIEFAFDRVPASIVYLLYDFVFYDVKKHLEITNSRVKGSQIYIINTPTSLTDYQNIKNNLKNIDYFWSQNTFSSYYTSLISSFDDPALIPTEVFKLIQRIKKCSPEKIEYIYNDIIQDMYIGNHELFDTNNNNINNISNETIHQIYHILFNNTYKYLSFNMMPNAFLLKNNNIQLNYISKSILNNSFGFHNLNMFHKENGINKLNTKNIPIFELTKINELIKLNL